MDRPVGLNSEDCQLEEVRCELRAIMQEFQMATASLGWRASGEAELREGLAVSVTVAGGSRS